MRRFTLSNGGVEVDAIEYGAIITSLRTPDHLGNTGDVVLGFDTLDGYLGHSPYLGAVVGRYANRIAGGRFTLDGVGYQLACNDGANHLHGGWRGFDKALWTGAPVAGAGAPGVTFTYSSADGEEGYPGRLEVRVTYVLTADGALAIRYVAASDATTIVNLTQHSYFNLSGKAGNVLDHVLTVNARHFTPVDEALIPTGELRAVSRTPFDFRTPTPIGERIGEPDAQLAAAGGYDHNFVLDRDDGESLSLAARVLEPVSRRTLEVLTTQPGMQFYSGNFLDGSIIGKEGVRYERRAGFCLETQHFPDSPNRATFPSVVLEAGKEFREETVFRFGVAED